MDLLQPILDFCLQILANYFQVDALLLRFPEVLKFLWAIPLLFFLAARAFWHKTWTARLLEVKSPTFSHWLQAVALILAFSFLVVTRSGPYGLTIVKKPVFKDEALDFVVDLSPSQDADDILPSRLEAVKEEILNAVGEISREGEVILCLGFFTTTFNRLIECSYDRMNFELAVRRLDTSMASTVGTNLLSALPDDYGLIRSEVLPADVRITLFILTDGGQEMWREKSTGFLKVLEPDWKEDQLKKMVAEYGKNNVRVIPVGIGGKKPVAVARKLPGGTRQQITTSTEEIIYTALDEEIIKKIARFSGNPDRYFILRTKGPLASWIKTQILTTREADYYVSVKDEKDLWVYPLSAGVILGSLALGALRGPLKLLFISRLLKKRSTKTVR